MATPPTLLLLSHKQATAVNFFAALKAFVSELAIGAGKQKKGIVGLGLSESALCMEAQVRTGPSLYHRQRGKP